MNSSDRELYVLEKLTDVHELATDPGRVQERLAAAWMHLHRIRPDDLPEGELRSLYLGIRDDLTFDQPTGDEGRLAATLGRTSDQDAGEIAARNLRLYHDRRERLD